MRVIFAIILFVCAAICESSGLLLGWKVVKEGKPLWWLALGAGVLALYMLVNTLQVFSFGRSYAIYGGVFILVAVLWARLFDRFQPDRGDLLGIAIILLGIVVIWFGIGRR